MRKKEVLVGFPRGILSGEKPDDSGFLVPPKYWALYGLWYLPYLILNTPYQ